jgi:YggT family protein
MMVSFKYALIMLINFVFDAYIFILLLRLILQKMGANWHNPISQFVVKITQPIVVPLRKIFPGFKGFDLAIVVAMFLLELIETMLLLWVKITLFPGVLGAVVVTLGMLGGKVIDLYFFAIIITVIMSWVPALQHGPLGGIVNIVTRPLMALARRFIPPIGGFDLSPIVILLALKLLEILITSPVITLGYRLAYSG